MGQVFRVDQDDPNAEVVNQAASVLRRGGIVLFPTDTVYGLGALAAKDSCYGAQELFEIKNRPTGIPVPLLLAKPSELYVYGREIKPYAKKLADTFWPGPLTIVVQASDRVLTEFRNAADDSVGLRCPDSELVRQLVTAAGGPIFASSANTHGLPAPDTFDAIEERIKAPATLILDGGATKGGTSSTVVVCTGDAPVVVRPGEITQEDIDRAIA
ncbi:MAG: threonylcarbamoyl-AMP synthase [Actinomycetes bacterium]|jgi:tRNA threonylcarbamoyl adenosine modification protein (Sua5/YciO/YrdC/YwlC family)|nr:threonylcarbamoyl-AMP synthase [Actinomycetes bacterium]